jgi:spermidine synthase
MTRKYSAAQEPETVKSSRFQLFLLATTAICGAVVMVIEVLGSRVLGPFFGVSLFVWTSLIAVTLVALAAGYATGGVLADRSSAPSRLYGIILAAGFLVLVIPYAKAPVLKSCMALGLRAGSLASATLLFGPSIFLLGCISPYVIKLAAREAKSLGKTVGMFYAVSTIGSFLGTLLTGFVFLAYFRTDRIFYFMSGSLVVLAVAYFLLFGKKPLVAALLVPALLLQPPTGMHEKTQANGTHVAVVYSGDTFYGNVKVLEYSYGDKHVRELMIDGLIQGGIDMANGLSVYQYPYLMEFLPYGTNPKGKTCLVLGLGAGIIPMWYEARGVRTDVVDVNPAIPDIAQTYFGFRVSGDVIVSDARYYLSSAQKKYDYIIVDVANGDWAPAHILSLECFRLLKSRLAGKGVVAINLIGSLHNDPLMTASAVRTLKEVFHTVKVYVTVDPASGLDVQNLEIIAYDDPALFFDSRRVVEFPIQTLVEANTREILGKEFTFPKGTPSMIVSDDYNPVDFFDVRVKESIRQKILAYTDWDMLI